MDINPLYLKKMGIRYVFCDLDNTLVPHFINLPIKSVMKFLNDLNQYNIKFFIISNNKKERVEKFCIPLSPDDFIYNAKKPLLRKIKSMMDKYQINRDDAVMIGDQFIIDIFTANRLGIKSILVLPIINPYHYNYHANFIIRFIEKYIYKKLQLSNDLINVSNELINKYEIL